MSAWPTLIFETEYDLLRDSAGRFVEREVVPNAERRRANGRVDRSLFTAVGDAGFLSIAAPTEFGGSGDDDVRFSFIISNVFAKSDVMIEGPGLTLQMDMALPYLLYHCTQEAAESGFPRW